MNHIPVRWPFLNISWNLCIHIKLCTKLHFKRKTMILQLHLTFWTSNNSSRILVAFNTRWEILNNAGLLWLFRPTSPNIIQLSCGHNNEWMILVPCEWIDCFIYLNHLLEESSSRKSEVNLLDQLPAFQGKHKIEMYQSPRPFAPSEGIREIFACGIRNPENVCYGIWE